MSLPVRENCDGFVNSSVRSVTVPSRPLRSPLTHHATGPPPLLPLSRGAPTLLAGMEFRSLDELVAKEPRIGEFLLADDAVEVASLVREDGTCYTLVNPEVVFCKSEMHDVVEGHLGSLKDWEQRVKVHITSVKKGIQTARAMAGLDGDRAKPAKGSQVLECIPTEGQVFSVHPEAKLKRTAHGAMDGQKKRRKPAALASSSSSTTRFKSPSKSPSSLKSTPVKKDLESHNLLFEPDSDEDDDDEGAFLKRQHQTAYNMFNVHLLQAKLKVLESLQSEIANATKEMRKDFLLSSNLMGSGTTELGFIDVKMV